MLGNSLIQFSVDGWSCVPSLLFTWGQIIVEVMKIMKVFPGGSDGKESACNAGDLGSIPELGRSLEKEMATHSSVLAWRIPGKGEPGRLPSIGLQRVEHD